MTLLPAPAHLIESAEGPTYEVPDECASPFCQREAQDVHHVVRRSATGGPRTWVKIDGIVVGNVIGLCRQCHRDVTGDVGGLRAKVVWNPSPCLFLWVTEDGAVTLDPHPPLLSDGEVVWYPSSGEGSGPNVGQTAHVPSKSAAEALPGKCPTCGREPRKKRSELEPTRPKRTISFAVPVDERENGAEVVKTLLEECAKELGREDQPLYFTLTEVCAFFLQAPKERAA